MSAVSCLQSEDQFLCSICLDDFTDPVTTPCGHNFCKACITQYWDSDVQCVCPICKDVFHARPEMKVNTFISEMASQLRHSAKPKASGRSEQPAAKPGEVQCDICTGTKLKAMKSCLKCEASYCQIHLQPHLTAARLKSHRLIHPVDNLEDRMCKTHNKPLELFCKTDQTCVCSLCPVFNHKKHKFVPLKEEYEGKKAKLESTVAEIQRRIEERQLKIVEIDASTDITKTAEDREKADRVKIFTALKKIQTDYIKVLKKKQKSTKRKNADLIKELQQEISELKESVAEMEQLSHSEDQLHLLQQFPFIITDPLTKDWTQLRLCQWPHELSLVKAVTQLEETISKERMRLMEVELKRIQRYAVDVTLDPDTAHPKLFLSADKKKVCHCGYVRKNLPDDPRRFDKWVCVLGKQSLSSGRFYYEVQVGGKTTWLLGVVRESINRTGHITPSPQDGYWTIWLLNEKLFAGAGPTVTLSVNSKPQKVGVFVDYEGGLVSFYDVNAASLIFSFTGCCFNHKLLPLFSPSHHSDESNATPLIISAVSRTV